MSNVPATIGTYDKDLCLSLCEKIGMAPFNIIELLPSTKQGILLEMSFSTLRKIKRNKLGKDTILLNQKLPTGEIICLNEEYVDSMREEYIIISTVYHLLLSESITKVNWTIYDFILAIDCTIRRELFNSNEDFPKGIRKFIHRALVHPKVNPLLVSVLLEDEDLTRKYFKDIRSSNIEIYKFCHRKNIVIPDPIKDDIFVKLFLCNNLPYLASDICKYILLLEIF